MLLPLFFPILAIFSVPAQAQERVPTVEGKTVKQWTAALTATAVKTRFEAFEALGAFGPHGKEAVPELLKHLGPRTGTFFARALGALKKIGPKTVLPIAIDILKDPKASDNMRKAAIDAARAFGPDAKEAVPLLVDFAIKPNKDYQVPMRAQEALIQIGPTAVPAIVKVLQAPDTTAVKRKTMLSLLSKMEGDAVAAAPALVAIALKHETLAHRKDAMRTLVAVAGGDKKLGPDLRPLLADAEMKQVAAAFFATLGADGKEALPILLEQLKEPREKPNKSGLSPINPAIKLLKDMGPVVKTIMPELIALLKSEGPEGGHAAPVLGSLGEEAIGPLMEVLKKEEGVAKRRALSALAAIGPKAKEALPIAEAMFKAAPPAEKSPLNSTLAKLGGDPAPYFVEIATKGETREKRLRAIVDLRNYGVKAKSAVPALLGLTKDPDKAIRADSLLTLGSVAGDDKQAIKTLLEALEDKDLALTYFPRVGLDRLGPEAVPTVIDFLEDKRPPVRTMAFQILRRLKDGASPAVPTLLTLLACKESDLRAEAALCLGHIRTEKGKVVPALLARLKDDDAKVRGNAAQSLGIIRSDAQKVVPALIVALKDADKTARGRAATALGAFGKEARAAIPSLLTLAKGSDDEDPLRTAIDALGRIGEEPKIVIPALTELVKTGTRAQCYGAILALERYGEQARAAGPAVRDALNRHGKLGGDIGERALKNIAPLRLDP